MSGVAGQCRETTSLSPSVSLSPSASASPSQGATLTANYDVRLLDEHGLDRLQGLGLDRDAVAAQEKVILYASTSVHPVVGAADVLRLRITDNVVPSAQLTVYLEFALGY